MDDWHFNNITKVKNKTFVLNHIKENKNLQFLKNGHIFMFVTKITLLKT